MAANKVKFEMTLKELTVKFEGDYEQGQRLQLGITKALTDIGRLQESAAGISEQKEIKVLEAETVRTHRRRKKKSTANGDVTEAEGVATNGGGVGRRGTGGSPTQLVIELRRGDFFQTRKTSAQIVSELNRIGHTAIKDSDLTAVLPRLCKRQILSREKDQSNVWTYAAGAKHE